MTPGDTFVFAGQVINHQHHSPAIAVRRLPSSRRFRFPLDASWPSGCGEQMVRMDPQARPAPPDVRSGWSYQDLRLRLTSLNVSEASAYLFAIYRFERPGAHHPGHAADPATGPDGRRAAELVTDYSLAIWSIRPMDNLDACSELRTCWTTI